ncbi:MAG: hypothetical protein ABI823_21205, partial [Bryobacteraceae bacterium]
MRRLSAVLTALLLPAAGAFAESHPRVWSLASPDATSLVGIQWQYARTSVFGDAFRAELSAGGGLDLPDFDWLPLTDQILVTGPDVLVIATGAYHAEFLKALPKGIVYRNIAMRGTSKATVAMLNETTLLLGPRKTVQAAIERSLAETRKLNPLFARGATLAAANDFWVIAKRLPDPVAGAFLPIDVIADEIEAVEGGILFRDGLRMQGTLRALTSGRAKAVAEHLQRLLPDLPQIVRGLEVDPVDDEVKLLLAVSEKELTSGLRTTAAPRPQAEVLVSAGGGASSTVKMDEKKEEEQKPQGPQVVRIFGLDGGPREIV